MNNDPELSSDIRAALADVSPADSQLRESHIAAALAEISPAKKRRISPLMVAAVLLFTVGFAASIATRSGPAKGPVATAHAIALVIPPKNMAPNATIPGFLHSCYLADTRTVALYTMDTNPMQVDVNDWRVEFKNNNSCAVAAAINIPSTTPTLQDPPECTAPVPDGNTLLATFDMTGVRYQVLASSTDMILFSCTTNSEVGRTPHPDYDNVVD